MIKDAREVLDLLYAELNKNYKLTIPFYNEDFYLVDIVTSSAELRLAFENAEDKNLEVNGLVSDFTSYGNIAYSFKTKDYEVGNNEVKVDDKTDSYIYNQLGLELKSKNSVASFINSNNKFVMDLYGFINGSSKTTAVASIREYEVSKLVEKNSVNFPTYKAVVIENNNLILVATESQMLFQTSIGGIKLHDIYLDIDYNSLLVILSKFLGLSKKEIKTII